MTPMGSRVDLKRGLWSCVPCGVHPLSCVPRHPCCYFLRRQQVGGGLGTGHHWDAAIFLSQPVPASVSALCGCPGLPATDVYLQLGVISHFFANFSC